MLSEEWHLLKQGKCLLRLINFLPLLNILSKFLNNNQNYTRSSPLSASDFMHYRQSQDAERSKTKSGEAECWSAKIKGKVPPTPLNFSFAPGPPDFPIFPDGPPRGMLVPWQFVVLQFHYLCKIETLKPFEQSWITLGSNDSIGSNLTILYKNALSPLDRYWR